MNNRQFKTKKSKDVIKALENKLMAKLNIDKDITNIILNKINKYEQYAITSTTNIEKYVRNNKDLKHIVPLYNVHLNGSKVKIIDEDDKVRCILVIKITTEGCVSNKAIVWEVKR